MVSSVVGGSGPRRGRPSAAAAKLIDQRILDRAAELILARGLAHTSIDEVAAAARASKTTIYSRFPSKEALFDAFSTSFTERHLQALDPPRNDAASSVSEQRALDRLIQHVTDPEQVRFLRALIAEGGRQAATVSRAHRRLHRGYIEFLQRTADLSELRADELLRTHVARQQLQALMSANNQPPGDPDVTRVGASDSERDPSSSSDLRRSPPEFPSP